MVLIFWGCTVGLLLLAVGVILPWMTVRKAGFVFVVLAVIAYSFYFSLGSSRYLKAYYMIDQKQRAKIQPLMRELKKQEYRLRFYLEEHPNDDLAHSQLLEVLGIQALQAGDKALAKRCLEEALNKIIEKEFPSRKDHLRRIQSTLD